MEKLLASAKSGDWLTAERQRVYGLMLIAVALLYLGVMVASTRDRMMPGHNQLGTDFSQVWVAGKEALEGQPEAAFDIKRHIARQRAEFGPEAAVYGWHYPPYFLGLAAPLAQLPYLPALLFWQGATLALYLAMMLALARVQRLDPKPLLFAAAAFPAVMVNLGHGQNGFLTAALLGGGFLLLDSRPRLAGALFALLVYKPQFAFVLPLALIIERRWSALAAAAASLAAMTLLSVFAFGLESWRGFFEGLGFTQRMIEQGGAGFEKIQSPFAAVRLLGGDVALAYATQAIVSSCALGALVWLWRSQADRRAKIAATLIATLLTTPYCLDYDMMALAPALALLVALGAEKGFAPYEKTTLAVAFLAPLLARPIAQSLGLPFGVAAIAILFGVVVRKSICIRTESALGVKPLMETVDVEGR